MVRMKLILLLLVASCIAPVHSATPSDGALECRHQLACCSCCRAPAAAIEHPCPLSSGAKQRRHPQPKTAVTHRSGCTASAKGAGHQLGCVCSNPRHQRLDGKRGGQRVPVERSDVPRRPDHWLVSACPFYSLEPPDNCTACGAPTAQQSCQRYTGGEHSHAASEATHPCHAASSTQNKHALHVPAAGLRLFPTTPALAVQELGLCHE